MAEANDTLLSSDKPLTKPKDDRLAYSPFAERLAESLLAMAPPDGFVVALYGSWGSGKTTVVNFIVHYLEDRPDDDQPIIVHFNPWWFSGRENLIRAFFDQLQAALTGHWKSGWRQARRHLAQFAGLVSEAPVPYASTSKVLKRVIEPKQPDTNALKQSIAETLQKQDKRIVIVIDDIDRLTPEEIRQLFRVIKAVADFPNVLYLLAFDREIVAKALTEKQDLPGDQYLEKIVQVPIDLPLPDRLSLQNMLFGCLAPVLQDPPDELFDQNYWREVYFGGVDPFITTPRDVVRLVNAFRMMYSHPDVSGGVNAVDFIGLETLRVFHPAAYDRVRRNREQFEGSDESLGETEVESLRRFHEEWLGELKLSEKTKDHVKRLLVLLYPKLGTIWGGHR